MAQARKPVKVAAHVRASTGIVCMLEVLEDREFTSKEQTVDSIQDAIRAMERVFITEINTIGKDWKDGIGPVIPLRPMRNRPMRYQPAYYALQAARNNQPVPTSNDVPDAVPESLDQTDMPDHDATESADDHV